MSTSDSTGAAPVDGHVAAELPGLIGGELELAEMQRVTRHLRKCADCRAELVEVAAGIGVMRSLDRTANAQPVSASPTASRRATPARRRVVAWAAAAVLVVAAAISATVVATRDNSPKRTVVVLAPVANQDARGRVAMQARNGAQDMEVRTTLGAAPKTSYYEVWLLERSTGKMLPVGVLPPDGNGVFRLSSDIVQGYDTVDISLQPDNGGTAHSKDSLLRANFA